MNGGAGLSWVEQAELKVGGELHMAGEWGRLVTNRPWCFGEASEGLEAQASLLIPSPSPGGSSRAKSPSLGSSATACPCPSGGCAGSRPKAPCSSCADEEGAQTGVKSFTSVYPDTSPLSIWKKASAGCINPLSLPTSAIHLTGCSAVLVDCLAPVFSSHQSQENGAL